MGSVPWAEQEGREGEWPSFLVTFMNLIESGTSFPIHTLSRLYIFRAISRPPSSSGQYCYILGGRGNTAPTFRSCVSSLMPRAQQQNTFWTEIKTLSDHKRAQSLQVLEESSPHFPLPILENPQIPAGFGNRVIPLTSAALESSRPTPQNCGFISNLCRFLFFTHWRSYSFMEMVFWTSHYIRWTGQEKEKEHSSLLRSALQLKLDTCTGLRRLLYGIWNS